jgi:hypothetical protein
VKERISAQRFEQLDRNPIELDFAETITLVRPLQNAFIESFNSRLREECLNEHVFVSLDDARRKIEQWRVQYNRERPHSSLGYLTPEEFAAAAEQTRSENAARTAWPADSAPAGAVQRASVSNPKPDSFSSALRK